MMQPAESLMGEHAFMSRAGLHRFFGRKIAILIVVGQIVESQPFTLRQIETYL
jgi:hypothetical protein